MQTVCVQYYPSPCGRIVLGAVEEELCLCDWSGMPCAEKNMHRLRKILGAEFKEGTSPVLEKAKTELDEYFAGRRNSFDIPLRPVGTPFQIRVWNMLLEIPYGETKTYRQIALLVDNPKGVRAVAQAIGSNALSIFIPCHRVIGSDNSLTGFAGGLKAKTILLEVEQSGMFIKNIKEGI